MLTQYRSKIDHVLEDFSDTSRQLDFADFLMERQDVDLASYVRLRVEIHESAGNVDRLIKLHRSRRELLAADARCYQWDNYLGLQNLAERRNAIRDLGADCATKGGVKLREPQ